MSKKRTRAQKIQTSLKKQALTPVVVTEEPRFEIKKSVKKDFFAEEKTFIVQDLMKTVLYTIVIIGVLFIIFVYTKSS